MRKPRSDSIWERLDPQPREAIEKWLFQEHIGYDEAAARLKNEFGLEVSKDTVGRYYRRREQERLAKGQKQAEKAFEAGALSVLTMIKDATISRIESERVKVVAGEKCA